MDNTREKKIIIEFRDLAALKAVWRLKSLYSINICGQPLGGHILSSIRDIFKSRDIEFLVNDKTMEMDAELLRCMSKIGKRIREPGAKARIIPANSFWVNKGRKIKLDYPWEILDIAKQILLKRNAAFVSPSAIIEQDVTIEGKVFIGNNAKVCRGAILKGDIFIGENTLVGNYSIMRGPVSIGSNARIGAFTEIKNSVIQDSSMFGPLNFISDSVIGEKCAFGAMVRTSNLRLDRKKVSVKINGTLIKSPWEKLGSFIGDNVQLGVGVVIMPGRIIQDNVYAGPRVIVRNNLEKNKKYFVKQELSCF